MARTLTNPEIRANITKQMVIGGRYSIVLTDAGTVDMDASTYEYQVASIGDDGSMLRAVDRRVPLADLPAGFRTKLKAVHLAVANHAESEGILGAGTDEDDFS